MSSVVILIIGIQMLVAVILWRAQIGCRHRSISWPQRPRGSREREKVRCLRCGREFSYDWALMRLAK